MVYSPSTLELTIKPLDDYQEHSLDADFLGGTILVLVAVVVIIYLRRFPYDGDD